MLAFDQSMCVQCNLNNSHFIRVTLNGFDSSDFWNARTRVAYLPIRRLSSGCFSHRDYRITRLPAIRERTPVVYFETDGHFRNQKLEFGTCKYFHINGKYKIVCFISYSLQLNHKINTQHTSKHKHVLVEVCFKAPGFW